MSDIDAAIGDRRIIFSAQVSVPQGFGIAATPDDGAPIEPSPRSFSFYWPVEAGDEAVAIACVSGDLTEEKRIAAERAAADYLRRVGEGAQTVLWRVPPGWSSERSFETGEQRHRFWMRGAFIWADA